jgi:hypothetical protein
MRDETGNRCQVLERDGVGMAIVVADAARDERNLRPGGRQKLRRAARVGAVVSHLQEVHVGNFAPIQQLRLHRSLRVAGQ